MIELRWLVRNGWDGPERVLQYRRVEKVKVESQSDLPIYAEGPYEIRRGEWQDVPTAREE